MWDVENGSARILCLKIERIGSTFIFGRSKHSATLWGLGVAYDCYTASTDPKCLVLVDIRSMGPESFPASVLETSLSSWDVSNLDCCC